MTGGKAAFNLNLSGLAELLPAYAAAPIKLPLAASRLASAVYGTDAGEINLLVNQIRPLQAGANETLNLYDGSLKTIVNESAAFRELLWAIIWVESGGDDAGVTIGGNGSNDHTLSMGGTTPTRTIYPSGLPFVGDDPASMTVDNTHKNVKVVNNGAVLVNYRLILAGTNVAIVPAGQIRGMFLMPLGVG